MIGLKKAALVALSLCISGPAMADPDPASFGKQLDSLIATEMQAKHLPGVSVAVLHKGEIVVARGYGLANIEHDVPVTRETMFQSGSLGKMFTAAVVMRLVEQGKLKLDDPVMKYIPNAPATWKPITIRNLLTHTSGIQNVAADFDFKKSYTDDELIKSFTVLPLSFTPGSRYSYSNSGFVLLGIIIQRATGRFYGDILKAEVFDPLGMKTARVISDRDIVPHRAAGYELVDGVLKNQDFVSAKMNTTADGSLYFSLNDLIAWARGVEQGKVLTADSWRQVYTPVRLNSGKSYPYGFGWNVDVAAGKPWHHHGGSWQGFRTAFSHYLGDDLTIILLVNSAAAEPEELALGVAKLWNPALVAIPQPKPEPAIDRQVTALIAKARAGQLGPKDVPLASATQVQAEAPYVTKDLQKWGDLRSLKLVGRRERGDDVTYKYEATFADKVATVYLSVGPGGQVSDFSM